MKRTTRVSNHKCGFCSYGLRHDLCPGGTEQGDGTILICGCDCARSNEPRCLLCGARGTDDVDPETWECRDPEDCDVRRQARLAKNATHQQIAKIKTELVRPARPRAESARQTAGKCLHCGEATKGGLFLPGHDAAYVRDTAATIVAGDANLHDVLNDWIAQGISDALQGKLRKRVTR
jgi:hypothetical protein